jgi:uncharacterized membrane protein
MIGGGYPVRFDLLFEASLAIQLHVAAAVLAFLLGGWLMLRRKGTGPHMALGKLWVGLMLVVVISSYWIRQSESFSWIHGLSVFTFLMLILAVWAIRTRRRSTHLGTMIGVYFGALVGAGTGALMPGRLLNQVLFGG